jgi:heptosyltransferase-1
MIALMRRAALVIGGDSGPVHLAAALGRPVVALFGPTDPARNGPWGAGPIAVLRDPASDISYKRTPGPDAGLAKISVEDVLQTLPQLL